MSNLYKPNDDEYPSFYKGYMDSLADAPLLETLIREKEYAMKVFRSIPKEKENYAYADRKWTVKQVLIHILDTEMVFGYRALAIARGEKQSLPGFHQDEYMANVSSENISLRELVDCFDHLRTTNTTLFKMLRERDLEREGTASGYKVIAKTVGYFIAGHARYHVNMLKERYGI